MFKKTLISLALITGSLPAFAQSFSNVLANGEPIAYVSDGRGIVLRNTDGLCWRTGSWTSRDAVPGCDGPLIPPLAKPTAPAIAPPAVVQDPAVTPPALTAAAVPPRCDFTVTLSNDQTFNFNRALLNQAARQRIEIDVLQRLDACADIDLVSVTGHSDRLGAQPYNQKLSEKRAEAVVTYMRSKGVNTAIDQRGVGSTQPVQACDAKLSRRQLIECLAPNRRVVIEVRGLAK